MQNIEQISDLTCYKVSLNADKHYIKSFLDKYLNIDNKLAIMTIILIIATGLFTLTIGTYSDDNVFAKKYKTQTVQQVNDCGNYGLPTNITCSNSGLDTGGQENVNNMTIVNYSLLPFP